MNHSRLEKIVEEVKKEIEELLPIKIPFTLKVKECSNSDWVAQYRGGTIIRSGRAIIWINDTFPEEIRKIEGVFISDEHDLSYSIRKNLTDTICHEIIHSIQEFVHFQKKKRLIDVDFNEEEAEELGLKLSARESIEESELIKDYRALLKEHDAN